MLDSVELTLEHSVAELSVHDRFPLLLGIWKQPEYQLQVGIAGPHQFEPIFFGAPKRALVRQYLSLAKTSELDQRDEALASVLLPFGLEALMVDVEGRFLVFHQSPLHELLESIRSVLVLRIAFPFGEDHPNAVVLGARCKFGSALGIHYIVGRSQKR